MASGNSLFSTDFTDEQQKSVKSVESVDDFLSLESVEKDVTARWFRVMIRPVNR
jgi:hypothetical protein